MNAKKSLKYLLPVPLKKALKYGFYSVQDVIGQLQGTSLKGYPPKRLNFVGSGEFKKVGDEFVDHFKRLANLKPSDAVLDIGCGIGRIALPLTNHLTTGRYDGFDIDRRGIEWCQKNISSKNPNFNFRYVDLFNKYYNKKGLIDAAEFVFPYESNRFDFVVATSVFTHMLPAQVTHYLAEINRVLKTGGTCFLTWFSIDEQAHANMSKGISQCNFKYPYENSQASYSHKNVPEAEIGYEEHWIVEQLKKYGCDSNLKIHHGKWSNRPDGLSYQDIFVSEKSSPVTP